MPMKSNREYRALSLTGAQSEENSYIVEGYATTYNQPYVLYSDEDLEIREVVDPDAFKKCDMTDVIMQYDHAGRVFARTRNNTLSLNSDSNGLHIRADLSGTESGKQLWEEINGGYTDKMSFGFVVDGDTRFEDRSGEKVIITRRITSIAKLYDVSAVSIPANDTTSISARGELTDGLIEQLKAGVAEQRKKDEARAKLLLRIKLMEV